MSFNTAESAHSSVGANSEHPSCIVGAQGYKAIIEGLFFSLRWSYLCQRSSEGEGSFVVLDLCLLAVPPTKNG